MPGKLATSCSITMQTIGGYLAYSSGLSLLCMVFFLIVVIIKKFQMPCPLPTPDAVNETMHMLNSTPHIDNVTSDDDDTCKPKYFVYNSQNVANVSFMAMFSIYLLAALFGYLTFYSSSAAPVLIFILPSAFYIKLVKKESMRTLQKIGVRHCQTFTTFILLM
ncbi:hypothetical protein XENOCAPTIV_005022 [Xenoophorus captivus]|uniref:Uncharacterized protein n=1 Tax=Xenoophorus captivus TaxID=1517983 RepID=A0ABV0QQ05_9TELE